MNLQATPDAMTTCSTFARSSRWRWGRHEEVWSFARTLCPVMKPSSCARVPSRHGSNRELSRACAGLSPRSEPVWAHGPAPAARSRRHQRDRAGGVAAPTCAVPDRAGCGDPPCKSPCLLPCSPSRIPRHGRVYTAFVEITRRQETARPARLGSPLRLARWPRSCSPRTRRARPALRPRSAPALRRRTRGRRRRTSANRPRRR